MHDSILGIVSPEAWEPHLSIFLAMQVLISISVGLFFQVGKSSPEGGADFATPNVHELPRLLPELFDQPGVVKDAHNSDMMVTIQA